MTVNQNSKRSDSLNVHRKNRMKIVKTIVQVIILFIIGTLLIRALFDIQQYEAADQSTWTSDRGFVAISYFGIARSGTEDLIAKKKLNEQLKVLKEHGYETISQQDVLDYYNKGKTLPSKALFLAFEDGRNDSSLFAQPLLEKYNFKATMLSYANKVGSKESKFLQPKDLLKMQKKGFWELGSNGYRLTYINIVDENGNFVGVRDQGKIENLKKADYYTHYLMDFIRDENGVPVENRAQMEARIKEDYDLMDQIYTKHLGFVPNVYMIMHANSMYGSMNDLVANMNTEQIQKLFKLHFNREGDSFNTKNENIYDLTRVQPAPYWQTNHLLMKLRKDTGDDVQFVQGDKSKAEEWELKSGAAEFQASEIALTSLPGGKGRLQLKGSDSYKELHFQAVLAGHALGQQTVYLNQDEQSGVFLRVSLHDHEIIVEQKAAGEETERLLAFQYEGEELEEKELKIKLQSDTLSVALDGQWLLENEPIHSIGQGSIALESEASPLHKDDIYDGVFKDIVVSSLDQHGEIEDNLFSSKETGFRKMMSELEEGYHNVLDWAIETF